MLVEREVKTPKTDHQPVSSISTAGNQPVKPRELKPSDTITTSHHHQPVKTSE
jgi:hypothetical protein